MSKLRLDAYSTMMEDVSSNLKSEVEELTKKVKKARESENWGTYKNLILAYKEIFKMYKDIVIDVCERDVDKTQRTETTVSINKDTLNTFANLMPKSETTSKLKSVDLFDEWDAFRHKIEIEDDSLTMKVDMGKLIARKLMFCDKGVLINVSGFRGVGKTYELIKFAKQWNYLVIVSNEFVANNFKKEYDYEYIYSQKNNLLNGIELKDCVVDEGVDIEKIKDLGLNIITGYINK